MTSPRAQDDATVSRSAMKRRPEVALGARDPARHRRARRPAPGTHPHDIVIASDAPAPHIEWRCFTRDVFSQRAVVTVADLSPAKSPATRDWIDVQGFGDEAQLRELAALFGVHPLALADIINAPQRAKVDRFPDHDVILLHAVAGSGAAIELSQLAIVVGPHWVLTFRDRASDVFAPVAARVAASGTMLREHGVDFLAYALIDAVVDGFIAVVDGMNDVLHELEETALRCPVPRTLSRIHGMRHALTHLERAQRQQRDAVLSLTRSDHGAFGAEVRPYLQDVLDHAMHVLDVTETLREVAVGVMDIYLSSVGHRTNEIMRVLTVMATIFIPLTFLAGVYGMNFDVMPELRWRFGYPALWAVMISIAGALLLWFRRLGWIGARPKADDGGTPP
jgi:magnesium transporter